MASKLIRLDNSILIEAEVSDDEAQPIAGNLATLVKDKLDSVQPILTALCRPVLAAWKDMSKEMQISQAEIEVGLSIEGSGDLFVAKTTTGANFTVKLIFTPVPPDSVLTLQKSDDQ